MKKQRASQPDKSERPAHRVRLPGFLIEEKIGLGDVIKKATYAMGIKPCGGCERRAAALNRWMTLTR
jgi:hypothetical protein